MNESETQLPEGERRLAAIMFTDVVGYTALMQDNESSTIELLKEQRRLLRLVFSSHEGREIKTVGDAFLVVFSSALDATLCAISIQNVLNDRRLARGQQLPLRIGIHVGDVIESENDILGDAVNIASRIEALAEPGGVCISEQVYDQVKNKVPYPLQRLGGSELKNVREAVDVYKVVLPWVGQAVGERTNQASLRNRIAVLPLVSLSPDPNDEYFADGMTEELITRISEIRGAKVIARTSVMGYKGTTKKVKEIGRDLDVGSVVEGSVRKAGNTVRITVQLIDSRTEEHLWASTYDRELNDIFSIQSDVASKVAGSLMMGALAGPQRKDTDDIEAYTLYIRAMQLQHECTESSLMEAIKHLDRAVSKDDSFSRAYAGLSQAWGLIGAVGYDDFTIAAAKAGAAARKALELAPDRAEAHAAMAQVHSSMDRYYESISEAEEAIRINPSLSEAYVTLGVMHSCLGDVELGLRDLKRAYELDPLSFQAGDLVVLVSWVSGRVDEAMELEAKIKELNPNNPLVYQRLAECYMRKGDFGRAQEMLSTGLRISPGQPYLLLNQGVLYALTDKRKEAEEELRMLLSAQKEDVGLVGTLYIQATLGNFDAAFAALARMAERHSWSFLIKSVPILENLRKDPRFAEFCVKVGIPP